MFSKEIIILEKKINLEESHKLLEKESNYLDSIVIKEKEITVMIYNIIPMAVLIVFECYNSEGFSRREIFSQVYEKMKELYKNLDPYKNKGIWSLFFDELSLNQIFYYPNLKKLNVSVS